jgi:Protein of unknown function (DUF1629)
MRARCAKGGVMAWWLHLENDHERGRKLTWPSEFFDDTEARMKVASQSVADELTARYFTPDPGPRPWPKSIYDPVHGTAIFDPVHGTYPWTGFRQPMPDRPYKLRFKSKIGKLPDCYGWMITNRVRDAIEALEPGVHQHLPVEFYYKDGAKIPEERWYLNICNRLDTIAAEHSDIIVQPKFGYYLTGNGPYPTDIKLWKHKVAGHAIWAEWKYNNDTYVSDALADAIREMGIYGWVFRQHLPEVEL